MSYWQVLKNAVYKRVRIQRNVEQLVKAKEGETFNQLKNPQRLFLPKQDIFGKSFIYKFKCVHELEIVELIYNGKYLLVIHLSNNKTWKVGVYMKDSHTLSLPPVVTYDLDMLWSIIKVVTLMCGSYLAIVGTLRNKKVVICYFSISLNGGVDIKPIETFMLPGYRYSGDYSTITAIAHQENHLAFIMTDVSRHPQPNLLYIIKCDKELSLVKFLDLGMCNPRIRGIVSGLCFSKQCSRLSLVATSFQYLDIDVFSGDFNLKELQSIYLEDDEEFIYLQKVFYHSNEIILALSRSAMLFNVNENKNKNMTHVLNKMGIANDAVVVNDFKVCQFNKLLYIYIDKSCIFLYDMQLDQIKYRLKVSHSSVDDCHFKLHSMNWYGSEIYASLANQLIAYRVIDDDITLKNLSRITLLQNFSKNQILQMNCGKKMIEYMFN